MSDIGYRLAGDGIGQRATAHDPSTLGKRDGTLSSASLSQEATRLPGQAYAQYPGSLDRVYLFRYASFSHSSPLIPGAILALDSVPSRLPRVLGS